MTISRYGSKIQVSSMVHIRWIITDDWGQQSSSHILWLDTLGTSTCPPFLPFNLGIVRATLVSAFMQLFAYLQSIFAILSRRSPMRSIHLQDMHTFHLPDEIGSRFNKLKYLKWGFPYKILLTFTNHLHPSSSITTPFQHISTIPPWPIMAPGTTGRADDHLADVAGALQELQSSHSALQTVEEVPGDGGDLAGPRPWLERMEKCHNKCHKKWMRFRN